MPLSHYISSDDDGKLVFFFSLSCKKEMGDSLRASWLHLCDCIMHNKCMKGSIAQKMSSMLSFQIGYWVWVILPREWSASVCWITVDCMDHPQQEGQIMLKTS